MKNDNIHFINLSSYEAPSIVENAREGIIEYGEDNNYFQYLIDRYIGSTTNQVIISQISKKIYGKGLDATDSNRKPEQYAQMMSLLKPKDLRKIIFDRKLLGMGAIQVAYKNKKVSSVSHFPMNTLRAGTPNDKGDITRWMYHPNWLERKRSDKLKPIPVFGTTNKTQTEVYIISSYISGYVFYQPVDYVGALPYAYLEEQISEYLINDIDNGFSGTKIINFNNGVPNEDQQRRIKTETKNKFTSAKGDKVVIAFNNNKESASTIDNIPLDNAPEHYRYLSEECRSKLITAHAVTSPLLLGVRDGGNGLGSNADEIKNASLFFDNSVIKSYQEELIDALDEILSVNSISLNMYFKTIQPLEFIDSEGMDGETKEEQTGVKMAKENEGFNDKDMLDSLAGELLDLEEWELVDSREYSEDNEDSEDWANRLIKEKSSVINKLSAFIKSKPNEKSFLDKSFYKIRYTYQEKYSSDNSREFCKTMMNRTAKGVVYRKEDIDQASFSGVNKSHGHKGQNYSLFKYKGGVNCGHFFQEELYRLKSKTEKHISKGEEVNSIPKTYTPKGKEYETSTVAPKDMPRNGHHPKYKG
jgi:hypothetical protein